MTVMLDSGIPTLTGLRVCWRGPVFDRLTTTSCQEDIRSGVRQVPQPDDFRDLRPGDMGTIGILVSVDPVRGHVYEINLDSGVAIETELPSPLVAIEKTPSELPAPVASQTGGRYVDVARRRWPWFWRRCSHR